MAPPVAIRLGIIPRYEHDRIGGFPLWKQTSFPVPTIWCRVVIVAVGSAMASCGDEFEVVLIGHEILSNVVGG